MSIHWRKVLLITLLVSVEAFVVFIATSVFNLHKWHEREAFLIDSLRTQNFTIDGCAYLVDPSKTPSPWEDNLVHDSTCQNPLHWSHVISDTSFYPAYHRALDSLDSLDSIYRYEMRP